MRAASRRRHRPWLSPPTEFVLATQEAAISALRGLSDSDPLQGGAIVGMRADAGTRLYEYHVLFDDGTSGIVLVDEVQDALTRGATAGMVATAGRN